MRALVSLGGSLCFGLVLAQPGLVSLLLTRNEFVNLLRHFAVLVRFGQALGAFELCQALGVFLVLGDGHSVFRQFRELGESLAPSLADALLAIFSLLLESFLHRLVSLFDLARLL